MDIIYLEIYSLNDLCFAPIETIVTLFVIKYCDSKIDIKLVKGKEESNEQAYTIDLSSFSYKLIDKEDILDHANTCKLPNITVSKTNCIAGLCAILRQIIKGTLADHPNHHSRNLLGFKESCLIACSEASVWTKFCEVDIISTLKYFKKDEKSNGELPPNIARFECHMSQPVRLHNIYKYTTSKKFSGSFIMTDDGSNTIEHVYAEGPTITLADLIIFVCLHNLLNMITIENMDDLIPLTNRWYTRMINSPIIQDCLSILPEETECPGPSRFILPLVEQQSLYKSDTKRYKPKNRIYTRQEDVERSLNLAKKLEIESSSYEFPFGVEIDFNWSNIPFDATPTGGSLPLERLKRKHEQLENMCRPVIKLAKPGDVIVDFCSGVGHLGILIAYLLPECNVILLENKEESLSRAKKRVKNLNLTNVKFCQCNLDYFKGKFQIGTSLHACGVATDLVIRQCIENNAVFVSSPCCYGSVQDVYHLTYPRSEIFRMNMSSRDYMILSHAADQTHDTQNAKTEQGYLCMTIIDTDRKWHAEKFNYTVYLGNFIPPSCTPKNHILIGIPNRD
ncbi:glutathione S-transferase C-terminal domain-containing protein homolog [Prorops nasuta]|uniref:glutathione S-transferase C-terminal domain-containing protein homolog n=1 Tax=Prorops nasuta TaxID=863751 RepID=UPI0034CD48CA